MKGICNICRKESDHLNRRGFCNKCLINEVARTKSTAVISEPCSENVCNACGCGCQH